MTQDCSRLKFVSAFFFFPMRSLLGRIGLRYDISDIANAYYREEFNRVPAADKAVILPHCLIGEKCKARFSKEEGVLCVELQTVPLRGNPRPLRGEGVAILHLAQHGLHETARPAKGDPGRRRGGLRFRDRKGDPCDADHPQGGPSEAKEGHPPGDPDGPVRLPGQRYRLGAAQADDRQRGGRRRVGGGVVHEGQAEHDDRSPLCRLTLPAT